MNLSPIHHTFAPLADARHVLLALSLLLMPWKHRGGRSAEYLARSIEHTYGGRAFLFASGRESLLGFFQAMNLKPGEEIIVQALTCVVVPNAIHAAGGRPVYADIDPETLNLTADTVRPLLSSRTRAIICQHTFGIPAPVDALRALCDESGIVLIEDSAHMLPDAAGPAGVGLRGDAVMLSFGRDKAISGVSGGAILVRAPDIASRLGDIERKALPLPRTTVVRLLCYPIFYAIARPLYGLMIGKAFLATLARLRLLVPIVTKEEKDGGMSPVLHRMPNALATLALNQWKRRKALNDRRRANVAALWEALAAKGWLHASDSPLRVPSGIVPHLPLQKFPVFVRNAESIRMQLKKKNIHLHDGWTGCVICPETVDATSADYRAGSDPAAESCSQSILSLPTHPTMTTKKVERLVLELERILSAS